MGTLRRGSAGLISLLAHPPRASSLDQRGRDVLGLGLAALGLFMAFVLYGGWDGGGAGHGLDAASAWLLGGARVLVPLALLGAGAWLLLTPPPDEEEAVPGGSRAAGAACLFAAVTLALAAETLGASSDAGRRQAPWTSVSLQAHGGIVGEALYQGARGLVGELGVDLLVVFLAIAGAVLLTGVSPQRALGATAGASRAALRGLASLTRLGRARRRTADDESWMTDSEAVMPGSVAARLALRDALAAPEPAPEELVVRATHVEAPAHGTEPRGEGAASPQAPTGLHDGDEPQEPDQEITGVAQLEPGELTPQGRLREVVTDDPDFVWELPDASRLLTRSSGDQARPDTAGQRELAAGLVEALGHFGVQAQVIGTVTGPHITRYELRLAPGTKVSKVAQLKDDLAYALAATEIRILAPIPGKQAVGVEVPNARRRIVRLGDVFQEPPKDWSPLTVWLGKDVAGKAIGADLAKMPHLLVAGTTGAGKSGAINAMLASVLLRASPHEVRLVLVDPKQVELNHYESIPHLLTPVITSPRMAANALGNLVREMEQRYGTMSLARTRSLEELNKARARRGEAPLPYILCVIDELADLMMVAPADVEDSIIRLAQKARAVGIHLVLATQSPRVDVITGMIKANVPSRIAFAVSSQTDSRVILDHNGAESLLGQGDMLFSPVGSSRLQRIQGAYIDEAQIAKLTELWRRQGEPELHEELLEQVEPELSEGSGDELDPDEDPLLADAITLVVEMQTASTSMLQRRLRLGYTRAGRMIDMLERRGVISGYEGSKPRQVLIGEADLPRVLGELGRGGAAHPPAGVES
ncbi:MAG TPA: DNA translocase FtsK [Solirubrobacteraceae bacterium]|nr:DNA translocase FtsK [Solirubrobacteraceae bacterium]